MRGRNAEAIKWKTLGRHRFFTIRMDLIGIDQITVIHNRSYLINELVMISHHRDCSSVERVGLRGKTLARALNDLMLERYEICWTMGQTSTGRTREFNARIRERNLRERANEAAQELAEATAHRIAQRKKKKKPLRGGFKSMADV